MCPVYQKKCCLIPNLAIWDEAWSALDLGLLDDRPRTLGASSASDVADWHLNPPSSKKLVSA